MISKQTLILLGICLLIAALALAKRFFQLPDSPALHTPITTSTSQGPTQAPVVSARPSTMKTSQLRKFVNLEEQQWPAPSKLPWSKDDYRVLPEVHSASAGILKDGKTFYFLKERVQPVRCKSSDDRDNCVTLPNGQVIEVSRELADHLPRWRVMSAFKMNPSPGGTSTKSPGAIDNGPKSSPPHP